MNEDNATTNRLSIETIRDALNNANAVKTRIFSEYKALAKEKKAFNDAMKVKMDKLSEEFETIFGKRMPSVK